MTDIVERLINQSGWTERDAYMGDAGTMLWDAIDEIRRLRVALSMARNALLNIERKSEESRAAITRIHEQRLDSK